MPVCAHPTRQGNVVFRVWISSNGYRREGGPYYCLDGGETAWLHSQQNSISLKIEQVSLTLHVRRIAEPQVFPYQAEAGQGPEAEQAYPAMDPSPDR